MDFPAFHDLSVPWYVSMPGAPPIKVTLAHGILIVCG
jgi:hypothetical protein